MTFGINNDSIIMERIVIIKYLNLHVDIIIRIQSVQTPDLKLRDHYLPHQQTLQNFGKLPPAQFS